LLKTAGAVPLFVPAQGYLLVGLPVDGDLGVKREFATELPALQP
jgi:hypothetical protein